MRYVKILRVAAMVLIAAMALAATTSATTLHVTIKKAGKLEVETNGSGNGTVKPAAASGRPLFLTSHYP